MQHLGSYNLTPDNRQYLRDNMNGQNLLNSMIALYFHDSSFNSWINGSKWKIKHGKDWASMESIDDSLDKAAKKQNWETIAYSDRYIYKEITNEGIKTNVKWLIPSDLQEHNIEWTFEYLDPSVNVTSSYVTAPFWNLDHSAITRFIHLSYPAPVINRMVYIDMDDYTNLTPLDYPNVVIV